MLHFNLLVGTAMTSGWFSDSSKAWLQIPAAFDSNTSQSAASAAYLGTGLQNITTGGAAEISNSLRFRASSHTSLTRYPSQIGDRTKWTWSGWVKNCVAVDDNITLYGMYCDGSNWGHIYIQGRKLGSNSMAAGSYQWSQSSTALFRDPSGWSHIVVAFDSTQATQSNRIKYYVNGTQLTSITNNVANNLAQNGQSQINTTWPHRIGVNYAGTYDDFYLSAVYFIDGASLTPDYFGKFDSNNVWVPVKYVGPGNLPVYAMIPQSTGTPIGDMTTGGGGGGGLAAGFNGEIYTSPGISPTRATTTTAEIGKNYGTGTNRVQIGKAIIYSCSVNGFDGNTPGNVTLTLYGYTTGGGWVSIGSLVTPQAINTAYTITSTDTTTLFEQVKIQISDAFVYDKYCSEVQFYSPASTNSYGTNGCHLEFKNAAALGTDTSGNGNTWTSSGFATSDQMVDTPTNNYCTWNPIDKSSLPTQSNGNLSVDINALSAFERTSGTLAVTSGKWYFEVTKTVQDRGNLMVGIHDATVQSTTYTDVNTWIVYCDPTNAYNNRIFAGTRGTDSTMPNWNTTNTVLMVKLDMDAGTCTFGVNGTWSTSSIVSGLTGKLIQPYLCWNSAATRHEAATVNFGQSTFAYTPPTGFKSLCTANLPTTNNNFGTFTGNTNIDGPYVYCGGVPNNLWINNSPVSWGIHADKTAFGFKIRTASSTFNSGTMSWYTDYVTPFKDQSTNILPASVNGSGNSLPTASLLFNGTSSYLSRTFTTSSVWTLSVWVKKIRQGGINPILGGGGTSTDIGFESSARDNALTYQNNVSPQRFRDPAAWHHVVVTSTNTWVDNQGIGGHAFAAPALSNLKIGSDSSNYFDGYMADFYLIDGIALTPSSFGKYDPNGVWVPQVYNGTYGTQGFHLDFSDPNNIGVDRSGNGNHWTANNFQLSDVTGDSPVNNFATLNPLYVSSTSNMILSKGALSSTSSSGSGITASTIGMSSGKWYAEFTPTQINQSGYGMDLGLVDMSARLSEANGYDRISWRSNGGGGSSNFFYPNNTYGNPAGTTVYGVGQIVGVAVDFTSNQVSFYRNGVLVFSVTGWLTYGSGVWGFYWNGYYVDGNNIVDVNFGQKAFAYQPPTGFLPLCSANLPAVAIPQPNNYFTAFTYMGTGATQNFTFKFAPDLLWLKNRSAAVPHVLSDTTRSYAYSLSTDNTNYQYGNAGQGLLSNGFYVTSTNSWVNGSGSSYAAWLWKKGATPGFDQMQVPITTGVTSSPTHSLGKKPAMIISKGVTNGSTQWFITHKALGNMNDHYINFTTGAAQTSSGFWGGEPTSTNFYLNTNITTNGDGAMTYLWSEIDGFSKFGSYIGSGLADGPFIHLGFRPRWLLIKRTDSGSSSNDNWMVFDTVRNTYNGVFVMIEPNMPTQDQGTAGGAAQGIDFLSNGFKLRMDGAFTWLNGAGFTYIYAAFAELPFGGSNVSPITASSTFSDQPGVPNQQTSQVTANLVGPTFIGKYFTAPTTFNDVKIYATTDGGFTNGSQGQTIKLDLYGSDIQPTTDGTAGTLIATTGNFTDADGLVKELQFAGTSYKYWWIYFNNTYRATLAEMVLQNLSPAYLTVIPSGQNGMNVAVVSSGFTTLDPNFKGATVTLQPNNLQASYANAAHAFVRSVYPIPRSGKWYAEFTCNTSSDSSIGWACGVTGPAALPSFNQTSTWTLSDGILTRVYASSSGDVSYGWGGQPVASIDPWAAGDVVCIEVEYPTVRYIIPNKGINVALTISLPSNEEMYFFMEGDNCSGVANFGASAWSRTPSTGFVGIPATPTQYGPDTTFTVTNSGQTASSTISYSLSNTTNFELHGGTLVSGSSTLGAGSSGTIVVRPKASSTGSYNGSLTINSTNTQIVNMSGSAT